MKTKILSFFASALFMISVTTLQAQSITDTVRSSLQSLKEAFQTKDYSKLQSVLAPGFKAGPFTSQQAAQIVPQVFAQYPQLLDLQAEEPYGNGDSVVVPVKYDFKGLGPSKSNCIFNKQGQFVKIELLDNILKHAVSMQHQPSTASAPKADLPDAVENFELVSDLVFVKVMVNGKEGYMILDSGAPDLILNAGYFASSVNTNATAGGINGGGIAMGRYEIDSFKWHDIELKNKSVVSMDLRHLEKESNRPIMGLIGYNLIKDRVISLDYSTKILTLSTTLKRQHPKFTFPFEMRHHLPVFSVEIHGKSFAMALDCGAGNNILDIEQKDFLNPFTKWDTVKGEIIGAGAGVTQRDKGNLDKAVLGNLELPNFPFTLNPVGHLNPQGAIKPLQGILGKPFLSYAPVTIDYVNKKLYFF